MQVQKDQPEFMTSVVSAHTHTWGRAYNKKDIAAYLQRPQGGFPGGGGDVRGMCMVRRVDKGAAAGEFEQEACSDREGGCRDNQGLQQYLRGFVWTDSVAAEASLNRFRVKP